MSYDPKNPYDNTEVYPEFSEPFPYEEPSFDSLDPSAYDVPESEGPAYETPEAYAPPKAPEIISTSQAINLTCTLASLSLLFGLFLCFADQKSHAVRRYAVQSVGLGALHVGLGLVCLLLSAILGWVPVVGYLFVILLVVVFLAAGVVVLVLRVRLMLHAYRGEAYVLPVIGEKLRRFE